MSICNRIFTSGVVAALFMASLIGLASSSRAAEPALKPAKERLLGKWEGKMQIDEAFVRESLKKSLGPQGTEEVLDAWIKDLRKFAAESKFTMEFTADGTVTMGKYEKDQKPDTMTDKYEIVKTESDVIEIKVVSSKNGKAETGLAKFSDNDHFDFSPSAANKDLSGRVLKFQRAK